MSEEELKTKQVAGIELLRRLGSDSYEIRYSEPELEESEESPVVWIAIGYFKRLGAPPQVAAGLNPVHAIEKLLENLVDGGQCQHCGKPTVFYADHTEAGGIPFACDYTYDPELKKYRRGCE